jgi:antirestriction protein ArdC
LPLAIVDKLPKTETYQHDPIEAAELIFGNMPNPPEIEFAGSKAFYNPVADSINCPARAFQQR